MESGKIIVVANQKGGVAKTSTVRNLSYALAEMGKKVLVVDFDPQYNLTTSFGVLPTQAPYNTGTLITNLLLDESLPDTNEFIQKIGSVDLIPSSRSLTVAEANLLMTPDSNDYLAMALHMKTLEIEFSLYLPSLTDMQKAILKQTIIELYNQFGIFWETDIRQLKATDFPILSDLHALLEKKAEANKENPVYRDLAMLLYDAAAGSDSFLWNGHTTLEANSRFICLDTHDLQNASDNVKRTQYLNLLSWCWEEMSRDRNERCLLVCDEAYLMIDPQVPQSLVFLRNVEKRARKYEAGLAIISHSVVDFLAPEVKMYGQALLDIPCYKILMGCDGKNLQETKDLYNLTDAEQELLESKRRGHALFIIGSKRLHVNFEIPAYKFSYMGKAGGR